MNLIAASARFGRCCASSKQQHQKRLLHSGSVTGSKLSVLCNRNLAVRICPPADEPVRDDQVQLAAEAAQCTASAVTCTFSLWSAPLLSSSSKSSSRPAFTAAIETASPLTSAPWSRRIQATYSWAAVCQRRRRHQLERRRLAGAPLASREEGGGTARNGEQQLNGIEVAALRCTLQSLVDGVLLGKRRCPASKLPPMNWLRPWKT